MRHLDRILIANRFNFIISGSILIGISLASAALVTWPHSFVGVLTSLWP